MAARGHGLRRRPPLPSPYHSSCSPGPTPATCKSKRDMAQRATQGAGTRPTQRSYHLGFDPPPQKKKPGCPTKAHRSRGAPTPLHRHTGQESIRSPLGRREHKVTAAGRLGGRLSFAETSNGTKPSSSCASCIPPAGEQKQEEPSPLSAHGITHQLRSTGWGVSRREEDQSVGRAHSTRLPQFGGHGPSPSWGYVLDWRDAPGRAVTMLLAEPSGNQDFDYL